jgi:hypothetical protein
MSKQRLLSILPRGGAAVTLAMTSTLLIGSVAYNNYAQVRDKAVMRAGVDRDKERLRMIRKRIKEEDEKEQARA